MNFNSIKNIIFDFDGIILDSLDSKTEAFYHIYKEYGENIANKVKNYHIQNGGVSRFEKFKYWHKNFLNINLNEDEILKFSKEFSRLAVENVINSNPIDGVFDFIKKYSREKILFIISGTPNDEINEICKAIKIQKYFKGIYGSPKNKIEWCNMLKKQYDLKSSETVFIGDSKSDYDAALYHDFIFFYRNSGNKIAIDDDVIEFNNFVELENMIINLSR